MWNTTVERCLSSNGMLQPALLRVHPDKQPDSHGRQHLPYFQLWWLPVWYQYFGLEGKKQEPFTCGAYIIILVNGTGESICPLVSCSHLRQGYNCDSGLIVDSGHLTVVHTHGLDLRLLTHKLILIVYLFKQIKTIFLLFSCFSCYKILSFLLGKFGNMSLLLGKTVIIGIVMCHYIMLLFSILQLA